MTLSEAFSTAAQTHLDKPAIYYGDAETGYARLLQETTWVAGELKKLGLQSGGRVALWLKNCPEFIPSYLGILAAGGVVVPINNFLKPEEVYYIVQDAGADILITDALLAPGAAEVVKKRGSLRVFQIEQIATAVLPVVQSLAPSGRSVMDLAVIVYTSGTTGHPKGAMLTHSNLLSNVDSCRQVLRAIDFDRFTLLLPMFHSFMMTVCILLPLTVGGSIVLIKSLNQPKSIFQEIIHRQATILPGIPGLFRTLAHTPMPVKLPIRLGISGAAPLPAEILKEFTEKTGIPLIEGYGLSEASPVVSLNPIQGPWKAGSIGLPIPNVEISIQDDDGKMMAVGEAGELCVRGPNVMQGYWNQPEETVRTFRGGWLLTGDVGLRDDEGYFYITDRKKDMLLVNGVNVYPREIEEVLYRFPGIKEAAVIGKPDTRKGEQPVAFVAADADITLVEKEIVAFVRNVLADYKVPRRVLILPSLPRNATGKILKKDLRNIPV